MKHQRYE